jgi:uncharacterized OB-fold protein
MSLPLPTGASELTRPFWEAAAAHRLVRPVCDRCGASFFVPQQVCPHCHSEAWTYRASSGRGVVSSCTVVHRGPTRDFTVPYVVAIVDLDEGWFMMSNIVHCDAGSVVIGQRVVVDFQRRADGVVLPVFRILAESRA